MEIEKAALFCTEHMEEMAFFFDREGTILFANEKAGQLTGYGEGLTSEKMDTIFPGILESPSAELETRSAYRRNRTCFPVRVKILPYQKEDTFLCIAYDATEIQLLENQNEQVKRAAENAQKTKTEFVANITHELRTPVNGILGNTRELAEKETDAENRRILALIERGCADMNAIINNILDISKIEAGKFT
jgi:signal transduction histidine kinase